MKVVLHYQNSKSTLWPTFGSFWHFLPLNVQNMHGVERLQKKTTCFFSPPLYLCLISSPGVSMATKSLSGGSLSADALTSIKSSSPSFWLSLHGATFTSIWQTRSTYRSSHSTPTASPIPEEALEFRNLFFHSRPSFRRQYWHRAGQVQPFL